MLQVRLSLPNFVNGVAFSDPIIIENAESVTLSKTISSSDEQLSFEMPTNDPKISYANYLRWWECWDTVTNARLNYGPINTISKGSGDNKRVQGPGRSALLLDYIKSVQTFYYPLNRFFDDLRYENMTSEPRTSTIINTNTDSEYYGLSKRSKDRAIDEQTGYISIGRDTPKQGTKKTDAFWAGTGKSDWLVVDLGDTYNISKVKVLLPWWGGATDVNRRTYDWTLQTSNNNTSYTTKHSEVYGLNGVVMIPDVYFDGRVIYFGEDGFEYGKSIADTVVTNSRYFKIDISQTYSKAIHATPTDNLGNGITDEWEWECNGSNVFFGATRKSPKVSTGDLIDKKEIVPANDCYASIVELGFYKKILGIDTISQLAYHQVDGASRQVTFYHVPTAGEMISAGSARKFEPGGFFRKLTITTSSSVAAIDEYNIPVYNGGSGTIKCPANSRFLKFTGSGDVQVTYADTWPSVLNAYSYSGSYSYTTVPNDYAILDFRGVSLKWFATIPTGQTPGTVSIELRSKDSAGVFSAWTTLEASFNLPADVAGEKVWEITYESGILVDNTSYQLRIKNLGSNYVSIDSFAGYWTGSFTEYNEDNDRMNTRHPNLVKQIYDLRFSGGSIHSFVRESTNLNLQAQMSFEGDRLIIYGRKGPGYGKVKIYMGINIPGGDADGGLQIDLNNAEDIAQAVLFDSAEYFIDPDPSLGWARYNLQFYKVGGTSDIWLDGVGVHETSGLSTKFTNTSYQEILDSTAKALQMEWDITEVGIKVVPRLGTDTNVIFAEGRGTTIKIEDVEDVGQVATQLVISGADIEGLPLSAIVEDKKTRRDFNRTIQRTYDLRSIGDYFTLIGAGRTELLRRREPQKRMTISTTNLQGVTYGDSFIIKTKELELRARAITISRTQSSSGGTQYTIECLSWPQII